MNLSSLTKKTASRLKASNPCQVRTNLSVPNRADANEVEPSMDQTLDATLHLYTANFLVHPIPYL
jgi:hypothetical protein